jgi:uncharacterized protein YuzE
MQYRFIDCQESQNMKINYYPETDSLYIELSDKPSVESKEASEGIVLDYDSKGNLVGIDIDNASKKLDLKMLTLTKLPTQVQTLTA